MPLRLSFVTAPVLRGGEGMCRACGVVAGAETTGFVRVCACGGHAKMEMQPPRGCSGVSKSILHTTASHDTSDQSCLWGAQDPPWRRVAAGGRGRARVHARLVHFVGDTLAPYHILCGLLCGAVSRAAALALFLMFVLNGLNPAV